MPLWLQIVLAMAVLLILAPAVGLLAFRAGRRSKGLAMMSLFLGLGLMYDPASRHVIEAKRAPNEIPPSPGDPPDVD